MGLIMYKINNEFLINNEIVKVTYSSCGYTVFKYKKDGVEKGYDNYQLHRLHKKGLFKPVLRKEIDEESLKASFTFLPENQKNELRIKIALVNQFIASPVKAGEEANKIILDTLLLLGVRTRFAESTVRGWVTRFKKSEGNILSLLDGRRKKPNF